VNETLTPDVNNTTTSEKNNYSGKPSSFNGDATQFSWWKRKMYSHIIGIYDELWDIIVKAVSFEVDDEGVMTDRMIMIAILKKI